MTDRTVPGLGLVLDCADPERLAVVWAAALGDVSVGTSRDLRRLAVFPDGQRGPQLLLQQVAQPEAGKHRMPAALEVADIHAEADRLFALGAVKLAEAFCSEPRVHLAPDDARPRGKRALRVRRGPGDLSDSRFARCYADPRPRPGTNRPTSAS